MRKRWKWAGGIVLVLLAAGAGWYGWQRWMNRDGSTPQSQSLGPPYGWNEGISYRC